MNIIQREDVDNKTIYIDENQKLAVKLEWEEPRQLGFPVTVGYKDGQLLLKEEGIKNFMKTYSEKFHYNLPYITLRAGSEAQEYGDYPAKFPTKRDIDSNGKRHISYVTVDIRINANTDLKAFGYEIASRFEGAPYYIGQVYPIGWFTNSVDELPAFTEEFITQLENSSTSEIVHPDHPSLKITYNLGSSNSIYLKCADTSALNLETTDFHTQLTIALVYTAYDDEKDYFPSINTGMLNAPIYDYPALKTFTLTATEEEKKRQVGAYGGSYNQDTQTVTWGYIWG